jgi:hypothetical protein
MTKKRYKMQTSCPQCGCSAVAHLSKEEIQERYGDVANVELECGECMLAYTTEMKDACPEWDDECRLQQEKS